MGLDVTNSGNPEYADYSSFDLDGPEHKQADREIRDALADGLLRSISEQTEKPAQETINAMIGEYKDYGSYVWVDYGDGKELAQALEEYGLPVTRVGSHCELTGETRA
jgi:hypothetical protein